jgi:hypothetical protein
MKTKKNYLGILAIVLIFGVCMVGCSTTSTTSATSTTSNISNFYNLGSVSDGNYALILVSPIFDDGMDFPGTNLVQINGQGNSNQWRRPFNLIREPFNPSKAIVRVTPGEYTFTLHYIWGNDRREIPVNITYNVEARKGYIFHFSVLRDNEHPLSPTTTTIRILECDASEIENYGGVFSSVSAREVARRSERSFVTGRTL